jgi:chromosome partitioning protein
MMTTIAVSNQKGGVAKTTTTLSLGACLAELGKSVLLIDLDPQAHLTLSMGLQPEKLRHTISDALLANASLVSASRESPVFELDIVPANQELALTEKLLYSRKGYEFQLKNRLAAMEGNFYNLVLIDCPPSFGALTLNALTAADLLIIPVQCEYYAAHALRQIIRLARMVQEKTNPRLIYQVLVTMYDRRNRISQLMLERMQLEMRPALFETIIEIDTKLRESPAFGKPITLYAPNTRGAQQYRALAQEVINHG